MSQPREDEILKLLKQGKMQLAFNLIVDDYSEPLYWHIRNMVNYHEDANDVLQNVFVKVWKGLNSFEGRSKVYSWLYRIASNECFSFIEKRKKRAATRIDEDETNLQLASDPYFEGDEVAELLRNAVELLPDKQRQIFTLKYFEDLKYAEINEIVGGSIGSLKASYHHAVKKIENFIKASSMGV